MKYSKKIKVIVLNTFVFLIITQLNFAKSQEQKEHKVKTNGEFEYAIVFLGEEIKGVYKGDYYKSKIDGEKLKIPHGNGVLETLLPDNSVFKCGNSWEEGKLTGQVAVETNHWKFNGIVHDGNPISGKIAYKNNLNLIDKNNFDKIHESYEGTFINHQYLKGELIFSSQKKYTGDFVNGLFEGKGTLLFSDGKNYNGDFKNNVFHGKGQMTYNNVRVESFFENGVTVGKSEVFYSNGSYFVGDLVDFFTPEGNGKMEYFTGDFENGIWKKGKFISGTAKYNNDESIWDGEFLDNKPSSKGKIKYIDGSEYQGEWSDFGISDISLKIDSKKIVETKNGFLILKDKSKYQGFFYLSSGVPNGRGYLILPNGTEKKGNFVNGIYERNVICIETEKLTKENPDPILLKSCTWGEFKSRSNGETDNKGRYYYTYELFKLIDNKEVSITNQELFKINKEKFLGFVQQKVNESFNNFLKNPETSDCFIGVDSPIVDWEFFNVEFSEAGIVLSFRFGLPDVCLSADGDVLTINYKDVLQYID